MSRSKKDGRHGGGHKKPHAFVYNVRWLKAQPKKRKEMAMKDAYNTDKRNENRMEEI